MVIFMMIFIVPKITASFEKTGSALPAMTQIVVNISNFFLNDWGVLIAVFIATIVFLKVVGKTYTGKVIFANIFIRLPVFGYIVKQSNIIYFIKSFTILIDAGVLLLEALKTSSKVVPNLMYKKELIRIKNEVEAGLTISKSL
jgi:type IV pilus assembly protein PilC